MRRPWGALAVLLLLPGASRAQNRVAAAPVVLPTYAAPAAISPVAAAPGLTAAPALAPSLAAPMAAPAALSAPAPAAAPVAAPALSAAPAAAAPAAAPALSASPALRGAAAEGPRKDSPLPAAAPAETPAPELAYGAKLFDGSVEFKSKSGSVFVPSPDPHPAVRGGFTFQLKSRALPTAPVRRFADGLHGAELLAQTAQAAKRGHVSGIDYRAASDYLFQTADHVVVNGVSGVVDAYSGVFVPGTSHEGSDYGEPGDADGDGFPDRGGMNVEHVWPQSLFRRGLPMRSDLHHLMATFEHPNGMRGNLPFGIVTGTPDYRNKAGAKRGNGVFEPPDITKGRVARALLYFYVRYNDQDFFGSRSAQFWNQQLEYILDWNRRFPPDAEEKHRNGLVEKYQGNRNPFIDDPSLADRIGAEALRAKPSGAAKAVTPAHDRRKGESYGIAARGTYVARADDAERGGRPYADESRRSDERRGKGGDGKKRSRFHRPHSHSRGNRR